MYDFRLKVFLTVAKRLSFTKAAAELFVTQPAVSKHIQELEEQFKEALFERKGNKIALTKAGALLLQHGEKLSEMYAKLEYEMSVLNGKGKGLINLGASSSVAQYVIPEALAEFRKDFPDIMINMISGNTEQIEDALLNKRIDFGIIEGKSKNQEIRYKQFMKDEIVLVCNGSNKDFGNSITLKSLQKIPLVLREFGSGTLEVILDALKNHKISLSDLNVQMQLGSTESIKTYIRSSNCFGLVSIHAVRNEILNGTLKLVEIKNLSISRYFYFITHFGKGNELSENFIKFVYNYYNLK